MANYTERLEETEYTLVSTYALAFDAMWTVAQVLNYTEDMRLQNKSKNATELEECSHLPGELVPLNEFKYSNAFMGCVMRSNYYKVNFTGVSVSLCIGNSYKELLAPKFMWLLLLSYDFNFPVLQYYTSCAALPAHKVLPKLVQYISNTNRGQ